MKNENVILFPGCEEFPQPKAIRVPRGVIDEGGYDLPRIFGAAMEAMQKSIEEKIAVFQGL